MDSRSKRFFCGRQWDSTQAQKQRQALNPVKRLIIRRSEPGSPILVSALGSDLDATVFHAESASLGLQVTVDDVSSGEQESDVSNDLYFDSFSGPANMAAPAGLDDLIGAMREMMHMQMQQMAQTTQLQQQLAAQQMRPPAVGQVMLPPAGGPALQPGVMKIRPTLPTFDGSGDADDHFELFVSIADAEGWTDAQR